MVSILCRSFFQSVCTLGYCLLPLTLALFVLRILLSFHSLAPAIIVIKLALIGGALAWSIWGEYIIILHVYHLYIQSYVLSIWGWA